MKIRSRCQKVGIWMTAKGSNTTLGQKLLTEITSELHFIFQKYDWQIAVSVANRGDLSMGANS